MTALESLKRSLEPDALKAFEIVDYCQILEVTNEAFVEWLMAELQRRIEE